MTDNMPVRCLREDRLPDDGFSVEELVLKSCYDQNHEPWTRDIGVIHPSSIHGCLRNIYYDLTKTKPKSNVPSPKRMLFDIGHAVHDMVQGKLANTEGFESEVLCDFPELRMRGHCDGVFRVQDWVLEIKTIGDTSFKRLTKTKIEHIWQVHCYMWMLDIPRCQVLYINRNTGEMRNFVVLFDYAIWEKIIERVNTVERAIELGEPPDFSRNSFFCSTCKFYYHCKPPHMRHG